MPLFQFKKTMSYPSKKMLTSLHNKKTLCIFAPQNTKDPHWRDAGVVDRGGLENRCTLAGTQGSNPCLSAIKAASQRLAAFILFYGLSVEKRVQLMAIRPLLQKNVSRRNYTLLH